MTIPAFHEAGEPLRFLTILVLEDNVDVRDSLKMILHYRGAEVLTAGTVREALPLVQELHPDVIVSDIGLPGENGLSFIRRVRDLPPDQGGDVPAIALSACTDHLREGLAAGFQEVILKPADPEYLIEAIVHWAGQAATSGAAVMGSGQLRRGPGPLETPPAPGWPLLTARFRRNS